MSILTSIRSQLAPIHREGYLFIGAFALLALILFFIWSPLGWLAVLLTAWCAYFFRDPPRVSPVRDGLVVSPADGTISKVATAVPPAELDLGAAPLWRISIFMNVFNCHVNRSPASGRIARVVYRAGKFINADLDKASEDNERNGIVVETVDGSIGVVQIAGLVARRIVCFVHEGDRILIGDRFGLIRFGSRLDVYLPSGIKPCIAEGQTAVAGETVIADLRAPDQEPAFRVS
jgi:phosphatidylserine decarboxylase